MKRLDCSRAFKSQIEWCGPVSAFFTAVSAAVAVITFSYILVVFVLYFK